MHPNESDCFFMLGRVDVTQAMNYVTSANRDVTSYRMNGYRNRVKSRLNGVIL